MNQCGGGGVRTKHHPKQIWTRSLAHHIRKSDPPLASPRPPASRIKRLTTQTTRARRAQSSVILVIWVLRSRQHSLWGRPHPRRRRRRRRRSPGNLLRQAHPRQRSPRRTPRQRSPSGLPRRRPPARKRRSRRRSDHRGHDGRPLHRRAVRGCSGLAQCRRLCRREVDVDRHRRSYHRLPSPEHWRILDVRCRTTVTPFHAPRRRAGASTTGLRVCQGRRCTDGGGGGRRALRWKGDGPCVGRAGGEKMAVRNGPSNPRLTRPRLRRAAVDVAPPPKNRKQRKQTPTASDLRLIARETYPEHAPIPSPVAQCLRSALKMIAATTTRPMQPLHDRQGSTIHFICPSPPFPQQ